MWLWSTASETLESDVQSRVNGGASEANALAADSALELLLVMQEGGAPAHMQPIGVTADYAESEPSDASDVAGELAAVWEGV
jgi:hypothetical protein